MGINRDWIQIALDSSKKSLLVSLLTACFLPPVFFLWKRFFPTYNGDILRACHWNGLISCHQGDLKHVQHMHIVSCMHTVFFWKNFHFVLILHIISRVQLLCESWQHGNYCHWSTHTTCSSIHSFPFLHWVLSSCIIGKLTLLKSDNSFSLGITPLLPGDYYYACKT